MGYASDAQIKATTDALSSESDFSLALADAQARIDSKLSKKFAVPFADGSVPAIVQIIASDLAAAHRLTKLYMQSGADDHLRGSQVLEKRGMDWLNELAGEDATIPTETASELPQSTIIFDADSASMKPVLRDFDLVNTPETCGRPPFGIPVRGWV